MGDTCAAFAGLAGKSNIVRCRATGDKLASGVGSGMVRVFSTPSMIALMEAAAAGLVQPHLPDGITTVGTAVNITHSNPTAPDEEVWAEATLTETDGRRFLFTVRAGDAAGIIGEGIHERFSVKKDKLEQKAESRRSR